MKITFKRQPKSKGLSAVTTPYPDVDIKYNKRTIGMIIAPGWAASGKWKIQLALNKQPVSGDLRGWEWLNIKQSFKSEEECREYIKLNEAKILELDLHQLSE